MKSEALRQQVLAYLASHNVMTLATVGPDGPWAAGLFYVNDGFDLYWLSDTDTRHSLNIAHNPQVAATIHEDYHDWQGIQGVQMEGTAGLVGSLSQALHPMRLYVAKFPFTSAAPGAGPGDLRNLPPALAKALATTRVYRLTPARVYFIDNTKGLGHREAVELPG